MIHLELFRRETSLYVDFSEYDGFWISPSPGISKANINSGNSRGYQEETKAIFKRTEKALNEGCFDTDCLTIFHDVLSKREIGIGMPMNEISKIYKRFVKEVEKASIKAAGKIEGVVLLMPIGRLPAHGPNISPQVVSHPPSLL